VDVADPFARGRIDPRVIVVGGIPISDACFADDHPGVVVAEDAGVFLVARRVRRNLPVFKVVLRVGRLLQDDPVLGGEQLAR